VPGIPFDEALRRMVIAPYKQQERGKRKKPKEEAPPKK
jgi:hypothetical protein